MTNENSGKTPEENPEQDSDESLIAEEDAEASAEQLPDDSDESEDLAARNQ